MGPTATGKSALGIELALRHGGEIISCDSTAVYRGFDIGTDKVPFAERRGIPHHLIDVVEPTDEYTAARYVSDAVAAIEQIYTRGAWPIIVGGTGLYYRALVRGLFPGPGADAKMRSRLEAIARRRGVECLHRMLRRVDADSAARIQSRDLKRMVRALEVFFLTGTPLTDHFAATVSPLAGFQTLAVALSPPLALITKRVAKRVDAQFDQGLLDEIRGLLARGVPATARPFGGLVYRQALDHLNGVRNEADTRELITRENRHYARRQLIWFRKEPNLVWLQTSGESPETLTAVETLLA
ncbi:MAG: tRNA (adenosine(37)-N6)-dimethylallyltransferase MiaA [Vicinamibacterales bacterium]